MDLLGYWILLMYMNRVFRFLRYSCMVHLLLALKSVCAVVGNVAIFLKFDLQFLYFKENVNQ